MIRTRRQRRRSHDGMTLVELLVVIMIVVLLVAAALPLAKPAFKDHKLHEASRQVAGFFMGAQARAAELRRPVGVWIERDDYFTANGAARSLRLFLAESPPPYVGDAIGARAEYNSGANRYQLDLSDSLPFIVRTGDEVTFDYKRPRYTITEVSPSGTNPPWFRIGSSGPNTVSGGVPFQIHRQPIRSGSSPLELPNGICIDLTMSGIGSRNRVFAPDLIDNQSPNGTTQPAARDTNGDWSYRPVVIMFDSFGGVAWVSHAASQSQGTVTSTRPLDPIHLLIGRVEQVYDYTTPPELKTIPTLFENTPNVKSNIMDLSTVWVSVVSRSGLIKSAENADSSQVSGFNNKIEQARLFTRSTRTMGGR